MKSEYKKWLNRTCRKDKDFPISVCNDWCIKSWNAAIQAAIKIVGNDDAWGGTTPKLKRLKEKL